MKSGTTLLFLCLFCSCIRKPVKSPGSTGTLSAPKRIYSTHVKDSFSVFISLPDGYDTSKTHYPVVYLLDANFYFDMLAPVMKKYASVGMLPPAILVGVGYSSFEVMDSLRNRDYTYPKALPEYEMHQSGGADKLFAFLQTELLPYIDQEYRTDTVHRALAGHSLGGYFTLYALQQQLKSGHRTFDTYIAASPSASYNNGYILKALDAIKAPAKDINAYITFGGAEDEENKGDTAEIKTGAILSSLRSSLEKDSLKCKTNVYSDLGHMDAAMPAFCKGLQWSLNKE